MRFSSSISLVTRSSSAVVPNLGPRRLPMADRSGPRMALIFGATLRMRVGQNNDQGQRKK
jgi:hypothetical protein